MLDEIAKLGGLSHLTLGRVGDPFGVVAVRARRLDSLPIAHQLLFGDRLRRHRAQSQSPCHVPRPEVE